MPEVHFVVRWPDGTAERCYSPSRVIKEYFTPGESYALPDFVQRSRVALDLASERVREKYGYGCAHAALQIEEIERAASRYDGPDARVRVEAFEE